MKRHVILLTFLALALAAMLAVSPASAEGGPSDPYRNEVERLDALLELTPRAAVWGVSFTEKQAPSLSQPGVWQVNIDSSLVSEHGQVGSVQAIIQSVDPDGSFSTTYRIRTIDFQNLQSCTFVAPGDYQLVVFVKMADNEDFAGVQPISIPEDGVHPTVAEKVQDLVDEYSVPGDAWQTALNLHDWLTHNAYYDLNYEYYGAENVLFRGTGVCDSYSKAYQYLLDAAGITNQRVNSATHAWNVVQLGGEWYHIDVTWDDPSGGTAAVSGNETHSYFCLNDDLIYGGYDDDDQTHSDRASCVGLCTSLTEWYPFHTGEWTGEGVYFTASYEIRDYRDDMAEQVQQGLTSFTLHGDDLYPLESTEPNTYSFYTADQSVVQRKRTLFALGLSTFGLPMPDGSTVNVAVTYDTDALLFNVEVLPEPPGLPITEANFPDWSFRDYISNNLDTNGNGELSEAEIAQVTRIRCNGQNISDLTGIAYFTALETLECVGNDLTTLDVRGCAALTSLVCIDNRLQTLYVSGCESLCELMCEENRLAELDLTGCPQLSGLSCMDNYLDELDISGCPKLVNTFALGTLDPTEDYLDYSWRDDQGTACYLSFDNGVTIIDGQSQPGDVAINSANFPDAEFRTFASNYDRDRNSRLTETELADVTRMDCGYMGIADLTGIEYFTSLEELGCYMNQLTALDVSALASLEKLECDNNLLTGLDIGGCAALEVLHCENNQLSTLDLSGCPGLHGLDCSGNLLSELDISDCPALVVICTEGTYSDGRYTWIDESDPNKPMYTMGVDDGVTLITGLPTGIALNANNFPDDNFRAYLANNRDVDGDGALSDAEIARATLIMCDSMGIEDLTGIEFFTNLEWLDCSSNRLTELDVSGCPSLDGISCENNQLWGLDLSMNPLMGYLNCSGNRLTQLNLAGCDILRQLDCSDNLLGTLDLSDTDALETLNCSENLLTSLVLNPNAPLETLRCDGNLLDTLDLSDADALETLDCSENQLTALALNPNAPLETLRCDGNLLTALDIAPYPVLIGRYYRGSGDFSCDPDVALDGLELLEEMLALPDGLTEVEDEAFEGISAGIVKIDAACERIGSRAFAGNTDLRIVDLVDVDAIDIADDAFEGCGDGFCVLAGSWDAMDWAYDQGYFCVNYYDLAGE